MLLVAIIVLIISIVNFINLSVLDFYDQSVNSAIRMIHGANITSLLKFSFYKEFLISLAAGLFSVMIRLLCTENNCSGLRAGLADNCFGNGYSDNEFAAYSDNSPVASPSHSMHDMMKKKIITGSGGKITREILITVQFAISIFLIAGTIVIFSQLRFIQKKDPGFVPDSIIFSYSPMTMNQRPDIPEKLLVFRDRVSQIPGVQSFCTSSSIPGKDFLMSSEKVSKVGDDPDKQTYFQILNVDRSYLDTYRLTLFSGRNFTDTDQYPGNEVIINQFAARKLGFLIHLKPYR
jgi:putative ABC transport system permease protein